MAVAGGEWRSQAAHFAASSSCMMIGDFAGEPLFMRAPCSHFEQTRTRGSDAAVTPAWPQVGQTIRVNMRGSLARFGLSLPHRLSAVDLLVVPHPLGRGTGAAGRNRRPAPGPAPLASWMLWLSLSLTLLKNADWSFAEMEVKKVKANVFSHPRMSLDSGAGRGNKVKSLTKSHRFSIAK